MAKRQAHRQITKMIGDMEKLAKQLRAGVRQRAKSAKIPARLKRAAAELKKSAGVVSLRVEKHARRLRAELKVSLPKTSSTRPCRFPSGALQ